MKVADIIKNIENVRKKFNLKKINKTIGKIDRKKRIMFEYTNEYLSIKR